MTYPLRLTDDQWQDIREHYGDDAPTREEIAELRAQLAEQEARNRELSRRLALAYATLNAVQAEQAAKLDATLGDLYDHITRLRAENTQLHAERAAEAGDLGDDDRDAIPF